LSLRLALPVAIALAARFLWLLQHAEKWDMPALMPLFILGELPPVIATTFVMRSKGGKTVGWGAGIAFGAALAYLIVALPLRIAIWSSIWDTGEAYRNLVALRNFIPISLLGCIWLLVSAFLQGRGFRATFAVTSCIAVVYSLLAILLVGQLSVLGSGALKEKRAYETPATIVPVPQVRALTACLVRHQFRNSSGTP
jgi:hypothetical protein